MKELTFKLIDHFGEFCGNGDKAYFVKSMKVDPFISDSEMIIFDFNGIRNMNSSFANAFFANLIYENGPDILSKVRFINCSSKITVLIEMALEFGLRRRINNSENLQFA